MKRSRTRYWDRRVAQDFLAAGVGILVFGMVLGWAALPIRRPMEFQRPTVFRVVFLSPDRHPEAFKPVYFSLPSLLGWSRPVLNGQFSSTAFSLLLIKPERFSHLLVPQFPIFSESVGVGYSYGISNAPRLEVPPVYRFEGKAGEWRWAAAMPSGGLFQAPDGWEQAIAELLPRGETLWLLLEADETGHVTRVLPLPPFDPAWAGPLKAVWRKARLPAGQKSAWIQIVRQLEWVTLPSEGDRTK